MATSYSFASPAEHLFLGCTVGSIPRRASFARVSASPADSCFALHHPIEQLPGIPGFPLSHGFGSPASLAGFLIVSGEASQYRGASVDR